MKDFQNALAEFAKSHPDLPWITGGGWGYSAFPDQMPDKKYIDAVISDRPVYVNERDGHMGLANSKALQIAGITRDTHDPPNGHIMKDSKGEPTGELKEAAQFLMSTHIPKRTDQDLYESLLQHMNEAAAVGLTSVQDAYTSPENERDFFRALRSKRSEVAFPFCIADFATR